MSEINERHILTSILTKTLGKTEDEVLEILYEKDDDGELVLNESADGIIIDMDASRVKKIREEIGQNNEKKFNDFAKKTKSEVLTKLEKELKDQYGVDSDKTGVDLIAEIVEASKDGGTDITEESLKTNPIFIKLEKGIRDEYQEKYDELNVEFENYKGVVAKEKRMSAIRSKAMTVLTDLNPVLSENQSVANNQVADFMARLDGYEYDIVDDVIIVMSDGERIEDGHGHPLSFDSFIKGEAEKRFDFAEQGDRRSAGNHNSGGDRGGKIKITKTE